MNRNQYLSKLPPMSWATKRRKLWEDRFYLSPADREELIARIESGRYTQERKAVAFIDARGEWI